MESGLTIRMFGGLDVRRDGEPIAQFAYDKVAALLAYLVLEPPIPQNRDWLAELFWPEHLNNDARHSLRQALFQLRQALDEEGAASPLILATRSTIQRNPEAILSTDVAAFDAYLHSAPVSQTTETRGRRRHFLAEAVALYDGDLLQGLSLGDGDAFAQWLHGKRDLYHRRAVAALDQLVAEYEQLGDYGQALPYAQRLVELEPWREEAHRRLMLLLARTGQRTAALKQYELCCHHLDEMLDVTPDWETERLYRRIRQMASARFVLPTPMTPFVGRQRELDRLLDYLRHPQQRLVTITGLGGMGKTRLAIQAGTLASREGTRLFMHGVVFVRLGAAETADQLLAAIAQALDFQFAAQEDAVGQLLAFLEEKELLLILDQFEELVSEPSLSFLSAMMVSAPALTLLVTSRQRLGLRGEQVLPLTGLLLPEGDERASTLAAGEDGAVALMVSAMKRLQPTRPLPPETIARVAAICRLVGGMPLAIELAASWTDTLSLHEIAAHVERNLNLLATAAPDVPARHRSIQAVFATSWQRLDAAERQVLAQLSIFRSGFTRQAAEAVTGASPPTIARLVRHSLLQVDTSSDRYDIHPLLQQYGAEKLAEERADDARVRERYRAYYKRWLRQLEAQLAGAREHTVLQQMDAEMGNIRLVWQWAMEQGDAAWLDATSAALHHYYRRRGRYQTGAEAFAGVVQSLRDQGESGAARTTAKLLAFQADLLREQGHGDQARQCLAESARLLEEVARQGIDTRREEAFTWWCTALLTPGATAARHLLGQSLAHYRDLGALSQAADVLTALGLLWKSAGDLARADACFEESQTLCRQLDTPAPIVELSYNLAGIRMRRGQYAESERLLQDGLALARRVGDQAAVALGLVELGHYYLQTGQYKLAADSYRESTTIREELGQRSLVAEGSGMLGYALLHAGEYREAHLTGERALRVARAVGVAPYAGPGLAAIGGALLAWGHPARAYRRFLEAVEVYREGWQDDWRARRTLYQALAACALCHQGDVATARTTIDGALHTAIAVRSLVALNTALPVLALTVLKEGQPERAVELYALAQTHPHVARSRWFADVVGRPIGDAAAGLPPDAAASARQRGQAQDLWETAQALLLAGTG
ncbi:MAG: BTAD domain-containing putative transcriptional regulator [Anaerolineae bacterium]|nr:BTAD domain-containing putative transcriptional regulator [Anaerolineae bacterium]